MMADTTLPPSTVSRVHSIDILRGIVMVIMAIDHTRDYWSQTAFRANDLSETSVALFLTRLITHFCAPTFIFLTGVGIFLYQQRVKSKGEVSKYLLTRGLWLVMVEIFIISFIMQFGYGLIVLTTIWAIGCSMILLAGLIWMPRWVLIAIAVLLISGHHLFSNVDPVTPANFPLAMLHNTPFVLQLSPSLPVILFSYAIIPWVGVMILGYVIGHWYTESNDHRRYLLRWTGITMLVLFVLIRAVNVYGDLLPWEIQPRGFVFTLLSFFNLTKYPPSLLFLLFTLGTSLLMLSVLSDSAGPIGRFFMVYGKVPFFYYVLHFFLIAASSFLWTYLTFHQFVNLAFASPNFPEGYEPSLPRMYCVWALLIVVLYFPCKWYGMYKSEHKFWWLSYL